MNKAGAAFDSFLPAALKKSAAQRNWSPEDGPFPAMFISHGAPPMFDDGPWMRDLLAWSTSLPKPRAILMISAHWEAAPLALSATAANTPLVYDFGGFDARYYTMKYPTPDSSALATTVEALMPDNQALHRHNSRGLDHGAWVPMKVMYPHGDVPIVQLSIPTSRPDRLFALGQRLRPLREEGVLIIGSGFMTHGLPYLTGDMIHRNVAPGWSSEFDLWAWEAAKRLDIDELSSYKNAPGMPYAHPTPEHFSPLFIALGAGTDSVTPKSEIDGFMWGLAKRSLQIA